MTRIPSRALTLAFAITALIFLGIISAEKALAGAGQGSLPVSIVSEAAEEKVVGGVRSVSGQTSQGMSWDRVRVPAIAPASRHAASNGRRSS